MRTTIHDIQKLKRRGERIPMLTAYDYTSARLAEQAGLPMVLVGDSLGMVMQGHNSTVPVTLDQMVYHTQMVVRGTTQALVVADLPFLSYTSTEQAIHAAARLMQEGGAQAVKLEGGAAIMPTVRRLVELGIPVMGHLGFTPQSVHQIGLRVQGKTSNAARQLVEDALALDDAGVFAIVLELIPIQLAAAITERVHAATIGIGAGAGCDGQVQVWHDLLGVLTDFLPRHARRYANLADVISGAIGQYAADVRASTFPTSENASAMNDDDLREALDGIAHASEPASV
ncbi:MAG: 3-methyl-2-oxobutanoate hydroxymethyltransferase [Chloroflexaceae bacterium]|nr:3-methyl-2-oxobutanoate hydroxymethyltransferase [Chloroflexaceae bacterium]